MCTCVVLHGETPRDAVLQAKEELFSRFDERSAHYEPVVEPPA